MTDLTEKLNKISEFIDNYFKWSQERGKMYGSIEQLESNWCILNRIYFILNGLDDCEEQYSYSEFLKNKGFGAKSATTIIKERKIEDDYLELNEIWNEYILWRNKAIKAVGILG